MTISSNSVSKVKTQVFYNAHKQLNNQKYTELYNQLSYPSIYNQLSDQICNQVFLFHVFNNLWYK